jgi:hypothetical protein
VLVDLTELRGCGFQSETTGGTNVIHNYFRRQTTNNQRGGCQHRVSGPAYMAGQEMRNRQAGMLDLCWGLDASVCPFNEHAE